MWLKVKLTEEDRVAARVARAVGVTPPHLAHWLTGHNRVPLDKLESLARYFRYPDEAAFIAEVRRMYPASTQHGS